jgi:hypothetical protein
MCRVLEKSGKLFTTWRADCKKTKNIRKCPEIAGGIAGNF